MSRRTLAGAALAFILVLVAAQAARADELIDPAVIHIGTGHGTACAYGCGGDPNVISSTLFSIYLNGAGHPALSDPLILILGLPYFGVGPTPTAPTLSSVTFYDEDTGAGTAVGFSQLGFALNGGDGILTAGQEAYMQTKFNGQTNNSNSFTNWSANVAGVTAFYLFAYRLNQSIDGNDLLNVAIGGGGLPVGTYAIAYGCEGPAGETLNGACDAFQGAGDVYSTPFTEAGFVTTTVPEPGVLLLLTTGFIAGGRRWRKRLSR